MSRATVSDTELALRQRLGAAATVLLASATPDSVIDHCNLLNRLVAAVGDDPDLDRLWLLMVAVAARFPTPDEVKEAQRTFTRSGRIQATIWLLDFALAGAARGSAPAHTMTLIDHGVVVDVNHSAKNDIHTGIQQVVRQLLPRWCRDRDITPVVWTDRGGAYRSLTEAEQRRVLHYFDDTTADAADAGADSTELVVPWHSVVVAAEVLIGDAASRLSAIGQYSGSKLVAIGYDCIPVVSADLVPNGDTFMQYLNMIKHADAVAGISRTAVAEFGGFVDMLGAQGLTGPHVTEVPLGVNEQPARLGDHQSLTPPMVLMVGSMEPRKNHLAVLHAAEKLWRRGLVFQLTFICGSEWGTEIPERIAQLTRVGRPITVLHRADTMALEASYRCARFSVFASKHEGYGLPIVESLAAGTPVITSNFGCMLELASEGGALVVDPFDDEALEAAMFSLLHDDRRLEELRAEIAQRTKRSWDDYAADLWTTLVAPYLVPVRSAVP
jgi:glycosyltransferase involved in cell wall biosynthesis